MNEKREREARREVVRLKDALGRALGAEWEWRDDGEKIWFTWIGELKSETADPRLEDPRSAEPERGTQ